MKTDSEIRKDVEAELRWTPDVDETDIAVEINGGEVTLSDPQIARAAVQASKTATRSRSAHLWERRASSRRLRQHSNALHRWTQIASS